MFVNWIGNCITNCLASTQQLSTTFIQVIADHGLTHSLQSLATMTPSTLEANVPSLAAGKTLVQRPTYVDFLKRDAWFAQADVAIKDQNGVDS